MKEVYSHYSYLLPCGPSLPTPAETALLPAGLRRLGAPALPEGEFSVPDFEGQMVSLPRAVTPHLSLCLQGCQVELTGLAGPPPGPGADTLAQNSSWTPVRGPSCIQGRCSLCSGCQAVSCGPRTHQTLPSALSPRNRAARHSRPWGSSREQEALGLRSRGA